MAANFQEAPTPAQKTTLLVKLAIAGVGLMVGAILVLRGLDVRALWNDTLALLREVGPEAFFAALAVLPAFGFPLSPFSLSAAPVFAPQIGLAAVLALFGAAIAMNLALTYWLSRYALRPPLAWLVQRLGYGLPQIPKADQVGVTLLVRITPGPPYFIQGYLLGMAEVPFKIYMLVSWPVAMAYSIVFILFGDSLAHGSGKTALLAVGALAALVVGVKFLRRRTRRTAEENHTARDGV
jgi:uncharacterized membrane protein YdjX (TVP38/TMEM64 family)